MDIFEFLLTKDVPVNESWKDKGIESRILKRIKFSDSLLELQLLTEIFDTLMEAKVLFQWTEVEFINVLMSRIIEGTQLFEKIDNFIH